MEDIQDSSPPDRDELENSEQPTIRRATLDALGPMFAEEVGRYVLPIFTDIDGAPVSIGTGFLLHTGRDHVLITAAHVLDGLKAGASYYFYAAPTLKRAIAGHILIAKLPPTGNREDDLIDVAAVVLEGDRDELPPFPLVGKDSMPLHMVASHALPRSAHRYAFLGFPSSKSGVNRITKDVRSASYAYLSAAASPDVYARLGLDEAYHIVLPFAKRKVVSLQGTRLNFPKPTGMSGSPLWELRKPEDGGQRVVGVMIERRSRENVVVATDIGFVLHFLAGYYGVPLL